MKRSIKNRYKNNSIVAQKILNEMNNIRSKPILLAANPISREDPSWRTGDNQAQNLVHLTEEKGHFEHLASFLEETIYKRREVACSTLASYPLEEGSK